MGRIAATVPAAFALLALAPAANAGDFSSPVKYRLEVSGEIEHRWTVAPGAPCAPQGSGVVRQKFAIRRATVALSRSGRWRLSPARFRATGTTSLVDQTRPGPPAARPCTPIPKSGCGTKRLSRRSRVTLRGERTGVTIVPDLGDLVMDGKCGNGRFVSFDDFPASSGTSLGATFGSERRLATRSTFGFTVGDTSRGSFDDGALRTTTEREVELRFSRIR